VTGDTSAGTFAGGGGLLGSAQRGETPMFRGALLWLIGIPLPIIVILWLLGYLS
jgi:hypothetical protein